MRVINLEPEICLSRITEKMFYKKMLTSMYTGRIRSSVTANMNLIGERFFWYRYRIVILHKYNEQVNIQCSYF